MPTAKWHLKQWIGHNFVLGQVSQSSLESIEVLGNAHICKGKLAALEPEEKLYE